MILRFVPYIGALDDHRLENIFKTVSDLVEDLAEQSPGGSAAQPKELSSPKRKVVSLTGEDFGKAVFCVPGLGRLDDTAVLVVADALKREGLNTRVAGAMTAMRRIRCPQFASATSRMSPKRGSTTSSGSCQGNPLRGSLSGYCRRADSRKELPLLGMKKTIGLTR